MAIFNITRQQALTSVTPQLRGVAYVTAIGARKHVSGAWLVIGTVPGFPNVYSIHWRSTDFWMSGALEFVDAFECEYADEAWARATSSAEAAWLVGPGEDVINAAERTSRKKQDGATKAGQSSGKVRAAQAESRKDALELAKKYGIDMLPQFDPRKWIFSPKYNVDGVPVIMFTWAKQEHTFAYIQPDGADGWRIGRDWYAQMNEDNGPIEETVARHIGEALAADDPAILMFERLLKTDPEKWLKGDYSRFE